MRTASIPSGSSPIAVKRTASSFRLSPASINSRTESVLMKVVFPRLPLPRTEILTPMRGEYVVDWTDEGNGEGFGFSSRGLRVIRGSLVNDGRCGGGPCCLCRFHFH